MRLENMAVMSPFRRLSATRLLGQAAASTDQGALSDAQAAFNSLTASISSAIQGLPAASVGIYQSRLQACKNLMGDGSDIILVGAASDCLKKLYDDIQKAKPLSPALGPMDNFPYIPVVVGALGVGALVMVLVVTRKK